MADQLLFLTELLGLKVYDLKGRSLGAVRDAALVPLVDPVRVDRYQIGGDEDPPARNIRIHPSCGCAWGHFKSRNP